LKNGAPRATLAKAAPRGLHGDTLLHFTCGGALGETLGANMIWIALGIVVIVIVWVSVARRTPKAPRNELREIFDKQRGKLADVRGEIDRVFALADEMFVHQSRQGAPQDRDAFHKALDNVLRDKLLTAVNTSTRMVHVVASPIWLRVICRDRPTAPSAIVHECWRAGANLFAIEHRSAGDFDAAIEASDAESQRVVAELKARTDIDLANNVVP
jgi:hypothetical protein